MYADYIGGKRGKNMNETHEISGLETTETAFGPVKKPESNIVSRETPIENTNTIVSNEINISEISNKPKRKSKLDMLKERADKSKRDRDEIIKRMDYNVERTAVIEKAGIEMLKELDNYSIKAMAALMEFSNVLAEKENKKDLRNDIVREINAFLGLNAHSGYTYIEDETMKKENERLTKELAKLKKILKDNDIETAKKFLEQQGKGRRKRRELTNNEVNLIQSMYACGASNAKVAAYLGVSESTIRQYNKDYKWYTPKAR